MNCLASKSLSNCQVIKHPPGQDATRRPAMFGEVTIRRERSVGFTLIERAPSKGRFSLLVASTNSANFPVRADSQTQAPCPATGGESWVTKSRDGNPAIYGGCRPVPKALHGNAEGTDCRTPKYGYPVELLASQSGKTNMQAVG